MLKKNGKEKATCPSTPTPRSSKRRRWFSFLLLLPLPIFGVCVSLIYRSRALDEPITQSNRSFKADGVFWNRGSRENEKKRGKKNWRSTSVGSFTSPASEQHGTSIHQLSRVHPIYFQLESKNESKHTHTHTRLYIHFNELPTARFPFL